MIISAVDGAGHQHVIIRVELMDPIPGHGHPVVETAGGARAVSQASAPWLSPLPTMSESPAPSPASQRASVRSGGFRRLAIASEITLAAC